MADRISREDMLIQMAEVAARRSTCLRLQVGAVIAIEGRVLSLGYNGAPPGLPHCEPSTCNPQSPCTATIHAEANAIAFASRYGVGIQGATLYSTHSPCAECSKLIISSGIRTVYFQTAYRDLRPLALLEQAGVKFDQWYNV